MSTERLPLAARTAAVYGVVIWVGAAVAVTLVGDPVFPEPDSAAAPVVVLAGALLAAAAAAAATLDYARRTGLSGAGAGLAFGVVIAAVGLVGDGLILLIAGFEWPRLDAGRTRTVADFLLLGYAAFVMAPWRIGASRAAD